MMSEEEAFLIAICVDFLIVSVQIVFPVKISVLSMMIVAVGCLQDQHQPKKRGETLPLSSHVVN